MGLMLILEVVLVVAPLAAVGRSCNRQPTGDPTSGIRVLTALALAVGVAAAFVIAHTPSGHAVLTGPTGAPWWAVPVGWLLGVAFWASVSRLRLPTGMRVLAVGVVLETSMMAGLVMLVAAEPVVGTASTDSLLEQCLAGGTMIVLDAVVLAQVWQTRRLKSPLTPSDRLDRPA
jgi:hypothetical protein